MESPFILECIINDATVKAEVNPASVLLDFLRKHEHLTGTKEGCREGDCGACTVLAGELREDTVVYRTINSCLMPLGDVHGMHIVTIEGLNRASGLNPVQQALVEEGGTQCGFCTPGFVLSLTETCIAYEEGSSLMHDAADTALTTHVGTERHASFESAADAHVDGNICRCTGHIPIKRAVKRIGAFLSTQQRGEGAALARLIQENILPAYFSHIPGRLKAITRHDEADRGIGGMRPLIVSGGTDLYVRNPFTMQEAGTVRIASSHKNIGISEDDGALCIPGTVTVEEFRLSPVIGRWFPMLRDRLLLFGSSPIRHRATVAGNIANASPIGDMTCILMALDASVVLEGGTGTRTVPLKKFYKGYKQLDLLQDELIRTIMIEKPRRERMLCYEKVSRRRYLDIASVNTAMAFDLCGDRMERVSITAGGVAPVMLPLERTAAILGQAPMDGRLLARALGEAQREASPISDARGSAEYKRLLLRQLLTAHVMNYFPDAVKKEAFS